MTTTKLTAKERSVIKERNLTQRDLTNSIKRVEVLTRKLDDLKEKALSNGRQQI